MKKLVIYLGFSILVSFSATAQQYDLALKSKRIQSYLNEMERVGFSGSVLVDIDGKKILSKGYGYRDEKKHLKNNKFTIFNISSITKQFTAAAILKLEMQGKLSVNDKIVKYFVSVPNDKADIKIHDLLRHQSGLVSSIGKDYDKIDKGAFINKVFGTKLIFKPGTQFSYSNVGYSLLAIIIEKISGLSYEDYLYENLFKPAGMEQTGTTRPAFNLENVAIGYYSDGRIWGKPTDKAFDKEDEYWNITGNGSILSNVEDMYKWHKALMSDQILSEREKQDLYHPQLRINEDQNNYYGYGWDVHKTSRGTLRIWHNGVNNIMYADFKQFIDENVTIITLSNKSNRRIFDAKLSDDIEAIIFNTNYTPVIPIAENEENTVFTKRIISVILDKSLEAGKFSYDHRAGKLNILSYIINNKGYDLINEKKIDQAIMLFEMNVYAFPESADAYDSLAEGYMDKGDKAMATKYYEKSLALNPGNHNAEDMLKKLK